MPGGSWCSATESIAQALQRRTPGTTIVVEPGEYRETLTLKSHVRLVSSVPRGADPPPSRRRRPNDAAAIVAMGVTDAALDGFRIVGDAATPLGTGVLTPDSELSISNVEITGAASVAHRYRQGLARPRRRRRHPRQPGIGAWPSAPARPR